MKKTPDCPMCETPNPWEDRYSNETYRYKGQKFSLSDTEYSVCRECGFDVVLPQQKRRNEVRVRDEHRRIDGLLTGPQIKAIRERLGLTQAKAAQLMGGGANAFSKYERGEVTQSVAMNQLLRVLDVDPGVLSTLDGRKTSFRVQAEQVSCARTSEVAKGVADRPIRNQHAKKVSVKRGRRQITKSGSGKRARSCRPETLAA